MRRIKLALTMMVFALFPATAGAATINATPSTFASAVSQSQNGDTILLSSGSYGTWTGTNKAITVKADSGASPTMQISFAGGDQGFTLDGLGGMSGSVSGTAHDITVKNSAFTGEVDVNGTAAGSNIVFDGNSHNNIGGAATSNRFLVAGAVTIRNSHFEGGGSDGVRLASATPALIENNTFLNILDDGSGNHTDNIQVYGGSNTTVRGNFFKQTQSGETQVFGAYDGTANNVIEDNVIDVTGRNFGIELYDDSNSVVRHNTVVYHASCPYNQPCGQIALDSKAGGTVGSGTQVYDNVAIVAIGGGSTAARNDHNVSGQNVSYVGSTSSYEGYALTSPKGTASDGLDVGARFGGPPPPPPPAQCSDGIDNDSDGFVDFPTDPGCVSASDDDETDIVPPPDDNQPVARFVATPEPSAPQQQVTFNATTSTCDDAPCAYHWHDIGPAGGSDFALGDGQTIAFAFQNVGTKYVELVVTDVDGDVARVEHDHVVSTAPPPPPPPPPPGQQLLGRNSIAGTIDDNNTAGRAQAYRYTASATGSAVHVRVYVNSGNTATSLKAGIYSGTSAPTTLRVQGSTSVLAVGQWADVTIPTTTLTSGTQYWIAILGTGGTLHFRDGNSPNGGLSFGSSQSNLTSLPVTWSNGPNWSGSWALSAYATT